MARPKEFVPDEVLARVMDHFWLHGYEGTSIDDLVRVSGIGRQSLYDTFGDKRQLYLAALDRFASSDATELLSILNKKKGTIRTVLRDVFELVIELSMHDQEGKGCMLQAAATLATTDGDVKKRICNANEGIERAFVQRLKRAQRDGELAKGKDPVALARFLAANLIALRTTGKTVRDRSHLESIADLAISVVC